MKDTNPNLGPAVDATSARILVVEDDQISRDFLKMALKKQGYVVITAEDASQAMEILSGTAIETFDGVVSDYRMPDKSGLELLAWIRKLDPTLATIIITAEGEKKIVAESLHGGAIDFLDKPIDLEKLRVAVKAAVEHTRRQRSLAQTESAVKEMGGVQERMLAAQAANCPAWISVCYHPRHAAGGDFFSHFQLSPDRWFSLLTDVSGHDLQAAYISAFFQGVVRGMVEREAPMEEIFATFNRLLLEESENLQSSGKKVGGMGLSVAACAIMVNSGEAITTTVLAHGTPIPVFWQPDGDAEMPSQSVGFPLGWFDELLSRSVARTISLGVAFCLWTDGLQDLAQKLEVNELSLAWALHRAKQAGKTLPELEAATDDVLLVEVQLVAGDLPTERFRPLILENYHGGQIGEIDAMQAGWKRSLLLAVPELSETTLHDILLGSREAMLNALRHGCEGRADRTATFQVAYCPAKQIFRVRVRDSGPGHDFDIESHEAGDTLELVDAHRGLILIKHHASNLEFERNGAGLTMDFAPA